MKTIINTIFISLIVSTSMGQEISKQVVANGGSSSSSGGYQIEQTIGETVVTTDTQGDIILCQGFQQVDGSTIVSIKELDNYSFNYYPNPVVNELNIELQQAEEKVNIFVVDQSGRVLLQQKVENTKDFKLDLSSFTSGIYFVQIGIQNRKVQFEIMKN